MIKASRALNDDFAAFLNTFRHQVTIPVPDEAVREIWERERVAGSFAVDGGLAGAHWSAQLESFEGLNPELPTVVMDDVIAGEFVEAALQGMGGHKG